MTYSVKSILWATDFSAAATNALAYAVLFAKTYRAGLSAIHVQPEPARFFLGSNTERVISFSEVPVFAIPAACREG